MVKKIWVFVVAFAVSISFCGQSYAASVQPPMNNSSAEGKDYKEVKQAFQNAGFTKIKTKPVYDLLTGFFTKPGSVDVVKIKGNKKFSTSDSYESDVKVVIKYHEKISEEPDGDSKSAKTTTKKEKKKKKKVKRTYTPCSVSQLITDLENNSYAASNKYKGEYIELTGFLANIDSNGEYISLTDSQDSWNFTNVQCYVTKDKQRNQISQMIKGSTVTIRGKVTDVGEVWGYSIDIKSIP